MNENFILGQKPSLKIRTVLSEKWRYIKGVYSLIPMLLNIGYSYLLLPALRVRHLLYAG
jgi:hypothetical protein